MKKRRNPASKVAETILAQLGGQRFLVMTGTRNFLGASDSLTFQLPRIANGVTHVKITLTPRDDYDVQFFRVRAGKVTKLAMVEGVYADQLRDVFTRHTGLETSLGTMGRNPGRKAAKNGERLVFTSERQAWDHVGKIGDRLIDRDSTIHSARAGGHALRAIAAGMREQLEAGVHVNPRGKRAKRRRNTPPSAGRPGRRKNPAPRAKADMRRAYVQARQRGKSAGEGAASWVFDGNTTERTYRHVLKMIEDGDPQLYDTVHEPEWLSGEWAGESVSELLGDVLDTVSEDEHDDVLQEYETAARDAYWLTVERDARRALK